MKCDRALFILDAVGQVAECDRENGHLGTCRATVRWKSSSPGSPSSPTGFFSPTPNQQVSRGEVMTTPCTNCGGPAPSDSWLCANCDALPDCYAVRPRTLGCQRCLQKAGHDGPHRSIDRGEWTANQQVPSGEPS